MLRHLPGKRVLIVEDNPVLAYDIDDLMKDVGAITVGPALDLHSGLKMARENGLDAALLDIDLGGEYVWPLARELRGHRVPTIFISAECTERDFPEEFRGEKCLDKPAIREQILQSLAEAISR